MPIESRYFNGCAIKTNICEIGSCIFRVFTGIYLKVSSPANDIKAPLHKGQEILYKTLNDDKSDA